MKSSAILFIITFITFFQSVQALELDIKCESPDIVWLNRFVLDQKIEAVEVEGKKNTWTVSTFDLEPTVTRAGNNSVATQESFTVSGTLTKIEGGRFTKEAFYNLKLMSEDKRVFANLNMNYPQNLSSTIRLAKGPLYKAKCILK